MIKMLISIFPIFLITSCHMGDSRPANIRSGITTVAGQVCISAPISAEERLHSLSISEVGNYDNRIEKKFTVQNAPELRAGQCLPNFDFRFASGHAYISSVQSVYRNGKDRVPVGNNYSVTFSLWTENGELKAADIN